ncbi:MAG: S-methyl-5-thioribose-1-phosphate isomerase [Planctomycetes bacterium]|nr:S-methyl-5-thioribose-1-phosphate isomerase [Planctomycetota bacterium]
MMKPFEWVGGLPGRFRILDQRDLPGRETWRERERVEDLYEDIRTLAVRGAPAIGVAAAYGVVLGIQGSQAPDAASLREEVSRVAAYLKGARPTAVNLFWALDRMNARAQRAPGSPREIAETLLGEARVIEAQEDETCRRIGAHGAAKVPDRGGVLTHCNAGGLATTGYGTALGVLYAAREAGKRFTVYVDETRPLLQGARLTAWELSRAGIDHVLLCDGAAASVMRAGRIQMAVVGADRIASNGDTANKVGTYGVAVLARTHGIPFYVAAPSSTFDLSIPDGAAIPIEERSPEEVLGFQGVRTAPAGTRAFNPAFDVTPARWITGIITEHGIIEAPDAEKIRRTIRAKGVR